MVAQSRTKHPFNRWWELTAPVALMLGRPRPSGAIFDQQKANCLLRHVRNWHYSSARFEQRKIMSQTGRQSLNISKVLCVIMGGGQGTRLFPLTKDRAKPAVPLAGKYRIVDIPISNCINSRFRRIYVLTQFNSTSLHSHISRTYKFDQFSAGFVEILAAQQTFENTSWYEGTADAVRKNLIHFLNHDFDYLIILSGDQLYRMDFRPIIAQHIETKAGITVATIP